MPHLIKTASGFAVTAVTITKKIRRFSGIGATLLANG
jgi:hypothetical protein